MFSLFVSKCSICKRKAGPYRLYKKSDGKKVNSAPLAPFMLNDELILKYHEKAIRIRNYTWH